MIQLAPAQHVSAIESMLFGDTTMVLASFSVLRRASALPIFLLGPDVIFFTDRVGSVPCHLDVLLYAPAPKLLPFWDPFCEASVSAFVVDGPIGGSWCW